MPAVNKMKLNKLEKKTPVLEISVKQVFKPRGWPSVGMGSYLIWKMKTPCMGWVVAVLGAPGNKWKCKFTFISENMLASEVVRNLHYKDPILKLKKLSLLSSHMTLYFSYLPNQKIQKHIKQRYSHSYLQTQLGYEAHLQKQLAVSNFRVFSM